MRLPGFPHSEAKRLKKENKDLRYIIAVLHELLNGGQCVCGTCWKVDIEDINKAKAAISKATK